MLSKKLQATSYNPIRGLIIFLLIFVWFLAGFPPFWNYPPQTHAAQDTWFNTSYKYRKKLTLDNTLVSGSSNFTNFPVLIAYTDTALKTTGNGGKVENSSGFDIIFTDTAGSPTKLDHEIEKYTATTGEIIMWVEIPTLGATTDTDIYIYYGNSSISSSQENVTGVWDSNFLGVWHLKEDPTGTAPQMKDSTSSANNGTSGGGMVSGDQTTGQVNGGLNFDGADDSVNAASAAAFDNMTTLTVSAWIKPDTLGENNNGRIMQKSGNGASSAGWRFFLSGGAGTERMSFQVTYAPDPARTSANGTISLNTWQHVALTWDASSLAQTNIKIYKNGSETSYATGADGSGSRTSDASNDLIIGNDSTQVRSFDGLIDEERISNVVRSADWIKTEYDNMTNQGTGAGKFVKTLASEEGYVTATGSVDTSWVKGGATGKNVVLTVNNSSNSSAAVGWVKVTRPSANYTLTAGSASGWSASVTASAVTFTGGSIATNASTAFTVTADIASSNETQTAWVVDVDDATDGSSTVAITASSSGALNTGIDATAPTSVSVSSITVNSHTQLTANAATASDASSGLHASAYWFDETSGGAGATDSTEWQSGTSFEDTGLSASTQYCYRVKARDAVLNESAFSTTVCATTNAPPADSTAPAAVTNLATGTPAATSLRLTWTAPGDDGSTGTATSYDVRYLTATITDANWSSATQAAGEPAPQVAGSSETFTVTGLSSNTTYYFALKTSDEASNASGISNVPNGLTSQAPSSAPTDSTAPSISAVASSNIAFSSVTITWSTDEASDSQVEYGKTTSYGSETTLDTSLVSSHTINISGLLAQTTYNYRVKSKDSSANLATSLNFTFATASTPLSGTAPIKDTTAPVISEVSATAALNSTTITWKTDEAATSLVEYGKDTGTGSTVYDLATKKDATLLTTHSLSLSGLEPRTKYTYQILSEDKEGNVGISKGHTITTLSPPVPLISGLQISSITMSGARITWKSDIPATSQLKFGTKDGILNQTTLESQTLRTEHGVTLTDLTPSTAYYVKAVSRSATGEEGTSEQASFTTQAPPPKPILSDVLVPSVKPTSAKITWKTNLAATSQVKFGAKKGEYSQVTIELQALTKEHTLILSDLAPATTYYFVAVSRDSKGLEGVSDEGTLRTESLEIQSIAEVAKPQALPVGSPGTQIPKIAAGETMSIIPILSTSGDTLPPEVTLFSFTQNPTQNTSPTIQGKATDSRGVIAGVSYSTDGGLSWHPISEIKGMGSSLANFSAVIPNLQDGNYPILFRARDNSGNIGKSEIKELIIDIKPPATGANIFLLGNQSLVSAAYGTIATLQGITQRVVTSTVGGAVSVEMVATKKSEREGEEEKTEEITFPLTYSKPADLWFGDMTLEKTGVYDLAFRALDGANRVSLRPINPLSVASSGKTIDAKTKEPLQGVKVSIFQFVYDEYDYVLWPGQIFNQANPQISSKDGSYSFIIPPGKYYITAQKDGYDTLYSSVIDIRSHSSINFTFALSPRSTLSLPFPLFGSNTLPLPPIPDFFSYRRTAKPEEPNVLASDRVTSLIGKPAPLFTLSDTSGVPIDLRYLRGKKTILTVWSTWSPQAQIQLPLLNKLQQENKRDVRVVLISIQESEGVIESYLRRGGYEIPSLIDREGTITEIYPIFSLPQHFFLDRKGIVRDAHVGFLTTEELLEKIKEL